MDDDSEMAKLSCDFNRHQKVLLDKLWKLYQTQSGVDFELKCGERTVSVHGFVAEEFLARPAAKFSQAGPAGEHHASNFASLLEFMYRGTVIVHKDKLDGLLVVAQEVGFDLLVDTVHTVKNDQLNSSTTSTRLNASESTDKSAERTEDDVVDQESAVVSADLVETVLVESEEVVERGKPCASSKHKCPECDYQSARLSAIKGHIAVIHSKEERTVRCPQCSHEFELQEGLVATKATSGNVSGNTRSARSSSGFACPVCDKKCDSRKGLAQHRRTHAQEKPFKCPFCSYAAKEKPGLKQHMYIVHGSGPGRLTCETCGKRCASLAFLLRHNLTHTKEKPFKCEQCPYAASQKASLKQHVDTIHGEGRFRCETCGKSLHSQSLLIVHRRTHTQEKPFPCVHCSYRANRKQNLEKHVKIVHGLGVNKHTCATCGKRCGSPFKLKEHIRTHTQEKPFKCPHCSHASSQKVALKQHIKVAHGLGPCQFNCETCGKRCQSNADLTRHRQSHHPPSQQQPNVGLRPEPPQPLQQQQLQQQQLQQLPAQDDFEGAIVPQNMYQFTMSERPPIFNY